MKKQPRILLERLSVERRGEGEERILFCVCQLCACVCSDGRERKREQIPHGELMWGGKFPQSPHSNHQAEMEQQEASSEKQLICC